MNPESPHFTPLVLLVEGQEWTARSLDSVLSQHGCGVFGAYTGEQGLGILEKMIPDLLLVDAHLPDMTGAQFLRRLDGVATVDGSTPRVLISVKSLSRAERLSALENGAWDILTPPFDPAELALRVQTWIQAKRVSDEAREKGLVDPLTGLYNFNGLLRRIDEIASDASRHERDLAIVSLGVTPRPGTGAEVDSEGLGRTLAGILGRLPRSSDAAARVGPSHFVLIAPGTDRDGAEGLVERLSEALRGNLDVYAGIVSTRGRLKGRINPMELVKRANEELRRAQAGNGAGNRFSFTD